VSEEMSVSSEARLDTPATMETNTTSGAAGGGKRPRLESAARRELDAELGALADWFDKVESGLELLAQDDSVAGEDSFTPEEQMVLIEVGDKHIVVSLRKDKDKFRFMGRGISI